MNIANAANMYAAASPEIAGWVKRHLPQRRSADDTDRLGDLQRAYNAPLMLAALDDLYEEVVKDGIEKVLFQSRDGCLMIQMWNVLHPEIPAVYFYASRDCWRGMSDGFRKYYERESEGKTCLVDFISAGKSTVVAAKSGADIRRVHTVVFVDWLADPPLPGKYSWSVTASAVPVYLSGPEMLNYDTMWQVVDVSEAGVPVAGYEDEYDMSLVYPMHDAFMEMLDDVPRGRVSVTPRVIETALRGIDANRRLLDSMFPKHVAVEKGRLRKWGVM